MNDIIDVNNDTQTVSARDLHEKLELKTRFSKWVDQNFRDFEEFVDYTSVTRVTVVNNGANREIEDYQLSLDMAKHLCVLSRTEKGKLCRQYLIDLEKAWNTPEQVMARALRIADETIKIVEEFNKDVKKILIYCLLHVLNNLLRNGIINSIVQFFGQFVNCGMGKYNF